MRVKIALQFTFRARYVAPGFVTLSRERPIAKRRGWVVSGPDFFDEPSVTAMTEDT